MEPAQESSPSPTNNDDQEFLVPEFARRWQEFHESVLKTTSDGPARDLQFLCDAWNRALEAAWTSLYLLHHETEYDSGHWELAALAPSERAYENLPPTLNQDATNQSIVHYSHTIQMPVLVQNTTDWKAELNGVTYRVTDADRLQAKNCNSLLCIPLLPSIPHADSAIPRSRELRRQLHALICAHYERKDQTLTSQETRMLSLMGSLSAKFIASSYEAAQSRIFQRMAYISADYLARTSTESPEALRSRYAEAIVKLIQEELSVDYVSIFYRNQAHTEVFCIASTGLYDSEGHQVPKSQISEAAYRKNDGLTGSVFSRGDPFISRIGWDSHQHHYKFRQTPSEGTQLAMLLYPIAYPAAIGSADEKQVLGVIRCTGNRAVLWKHMLRNFDPIQVQILDFISRMLAPVLETIAINIERERTITIVKHDLFAPLRMIEDSIEDATRHLENGIPPNQYFVPDLQFSIQTVKNLVAQLDRNPTLIGSFHPIPTGLEGDIVMAVKQMLSHYARQTNQMTLFIEDIASVIPILILDRDLISRAFYNLITNAVKYGSKNSVIWVCTRSDSQGYYLDIINGGIGIPPEETQKIFDEGYRGSNARHQSLGLGMGLTIAKAIMEKHGGRLDLISTANPTVFSMFFPRKLKY